jgi:hypothetical protein
MLDFLNLKLESRCPCVKSSTVTDCFTRKEYITRKDWTYSNSSDPEDKTKKEHNNDNPEKQAQLGTQDKRQTKHNKNTTRTRSKTINYTGKKKSGAGMDTWKERNVSYIRDENKFTNNVKTSDLLNTGTQTDRT